MPVLTLSTSEMAEIIAKYYGLSKDKVEIIGNGATAKIILPLSATKADTPKASHVYTNNPWDR
jgi:hypothetical protein